jgi:hypothetical protein
MRHHEQYNGEAKVLPIEIIVVNSFTNFLKKFKHTTCRKLLGLEEVGA